MGGFSTRLSELTQNVIRSSHGHSTPSLKISCKSVQPFSRDVANIKKTKKEIERKQYPVPLITALAAGLDAWVGLSASVWSLKTLTSHSFFAARTKRSVCRAKKKHSSAPRVLPSTFRKKHITLRRRLLVPISLSVCAADKRRRTDDHAGDCERAESCRCKSALTVNGKKLSPSLPNVSQLQVPTKLPRRETVRGKSLKNRGLHVPSVPPRVYRCNCDYGAV